VAEADAIVELMRQEVEALREEYGIPQRGEPLDQDNAPSTDALWGYVEDLENALAAQRVTRRMERPLG
jgi:hypothetical protein